MSVDSRRAIPDREGMLRALVGLRFLADSLPSRGRVALGLTLFAACSSGPAQRPASTESQSETTTTSTSTEDPALRGDAPQPNAQEDAVPDDTRIDTTGVQAATAGATGTPPPASLSEPSGRVDDAQFVGRWMISGSTSTAGPPGSPPGSGGGGAIGWMREYEVRADHTFQMNAYPSLTLRGTWRRVGTTGARAELVHADSRRPDGTAIVEGVTGLAEAGQPLRVLEIAGQRFPRVEVATPPAVSGAPTQPSRTP